MARILASEHSMSLIPLSNQQQDLGNGLNSRFTRHFWCDDSVANSHLSGIFSAFHVFHPGYLGYTGHRPTGHVQIVGSRPPCPGRVV